MKSWRSARLDECCEIVGGSTPSTSVAAYWDGDVPWATPRDLAGLETSTLSDTPRKLTAAGLKASGADLLPPGSVLFSSRAPIGHVAINTVPMATNQGFKSFVPDISQLDNRFLYWWLRCNKTYLQGLGNGATFKEVSKTAVARITIPLPPLGEQRRIADILDQANSLRAKRRAVLEQSGLIAKAIFSDVFGDPLANPWAWPRVSLDECATQVTDGEHLTPLRAAAGIKLLSARNVRDGFIDFDNVDFIGTAEYERIRRRCEPVRGDVLISCSGSIGRVAPVDTDEPFALVRSAALVRPNTEVVRTQFLQYMLRTPAVQLQMARSANASSQANLFQRQIRDLSILRPPLDMQDAFAVQVGAVESVRAKIRESLSHLNALFVALQQRAFRGEL